MYSGATALALVVLLVAFETGSALNCYQCTSTNNQHCKDPFSSPKDVTSVNCDSNEVVNFYRSYLSTFLPAPQTANTPRYCVKMILESSSGDTTVRTCVEGNSNNMNKTCSELERSTQSTIGQIASTVTRTSLKYCNVCDKEVCNGAAGTAASLTFVAGAAMLTYLFHH